MQVTGRCINKWSPVNLWGYSGSIEVGGLQHREAKSCLNVFNIPKGAGFVVMSLRAACRITGSPSSNGHQHCCVTLKLQDVYYVLNK